MQKQILLRLDEELANKLKELAKLDRRSRTNYINIVLEKHIENAVQ